jgi:CheY-specific phosphatase CheX
MPPPNNNPGFGKTSPMPKMDNLRSRFGLAPLPANVQKIAGLARAKSDASMDELVKIIDADRSVTERMVAMAYPRPAARIGATMQMATARLGVNRIIIVMIGDLLKQAVIDTFQTMFSIGLEAEDAAALVMGGYDMWTGSVKFSGDNNGEVTLAFSRPLSLLVVANLTGGTLEDQYPVEVVSDAVGEIVNIVTGNLQSRLADAGFPSEVEVPKVRIASSLPKETIPGGSSDHFFFRNGIYRVGANLCIAPFSSTT